MSDLRPSSGELVLIWALILIITVLVVVLFSIGLGVFG